MATPTEQRPAAAGRSWPRAAQTAALAAAVLLAGCGPPDADTAPGAESWTVTAWGQLYEVFPEVGPLVAGAATPAHTHVTVLEGFAPLTAGDVAIVLRGPGGEQVFEAATPSRPGIFTIEVTSATHGEHELLFRVRAAAGDEEIRGGAVRVGTAEAPGRVVRAPAPRGASDPGEPVPFVKEQQWRTAFATDWVRRGSLAESARGLARVRPPAGGEATLTASVDGIVQPSPWPFPGEAVREGQVLFRVVPRVASERSLPALAAEVAGLEAEAAAARARLGRLQELLELEATSRREVEEARTRLAVADARLNAARRDLAAAGAARDGRGAAGAHAVRAPFAGRIAALGASPGAAVAAGEALGRMVRSGQVWLEVDLPPDPARRLAAQGAAGLVVAPEEGETLRLPAEAVRLVSLAPEVDPARGTVTALLEVEAPSLLLGTTVEAEVLLQGQRAGIVVPVSALVDDGGVTVVYLQLAGESFARQEVEVAARQGDLALVEGLVPGQRLVTRGGEAIRRAGLMSGGAADGHVH